MKTERNGPYLVQFSNGGKPRPFYIKKKIIYKMTRLASKVWFSNGSTIGQPNFKTFRFRMYSEFKHSVFEPPL